MDRRVDQLVDAGSAQLAGMVDSLCDSEFASKARSRRAARAAMMRRRRIAHMGERVAGMWQGATGAVAGVPAVVLGERIVLRRDGATNPLRRAQDSLRSLGALSERLPGRRRQRQGLSRAMSQAGERISGAAGVASASLARATGRKQRRRSDTFGAISGAVKALALGKLAADWLQARRMRENPKRWLMAKREARMGTAAPTMTNTGRWLMALGLGAAAMFFLDPQMGNRRRALVRDQVTRLPRVTGDFLSGAGRDLSNRTQGLRAIARRSNGNEPVSDAVLEQRVRSKMGGVVSHPRSIDVSVHEGQVTLSGPILAAEEAPLIERVASVRGVVGVVNRLDVHTEPGNVPGLQGEPQMPRRRLGLIRSPWTPGIRLISAMAGGMLTFTGLRAGGLFGVVRSLVGMGLLARGVANVPLPTLISETGEALAASTLQERPGWQQPGSVA